MNKPKPISRRAWLKKAAVMASTAALYPFGAWISTEAAEVSKKVPKATARYQNRPHDGKMCGRCKYFISPDGRSGRGMMGGMMNGGMGPGMMKDGTCQLVDGQISPMGYCIFYAPTHD